MIVEDIDFSDLIDSILSLFEKNLDRDRYGQIQAGIRQNIFFLCIANLRCYQANMRVIAARKKEPLDTQLISDMELQARVVGEQRVKSKAVINSLLSSVYLPEHRSSVSEQGWMSDDIVYSVGEMIDRLTIEYIKRVDYRSRIEECPGEKQELLTKIRLSEDWSNRVFRYLDFKLKEIKRKGYYESVAETRTYNLTNIEVPDFFKHH